MLGYSNEIHLLQKYQRESKIHEASQKSAKIQGQSLLGIISP